MKNDNNQMSKNGFSLVEILIYLALLGIIFTGVFGVLISGLRYFQMIDKVAELQETAMIAISNVSSELPEASSGSIIKETGISNWVMFSSPKNINTAAYSFDSSGEMGWQKWIAYYLETQPDGTQNLVKKEFAISPAKAGSPGSPPYSQVSQLKAAATSYKKVVARGVETFEIEQDGLSSNYFIRVTIDRTTDRMRPNKITAETEVGVIN